MLGSLFFNLLKQETIFNNYPHYPYRSISHLRLLALRILERIRP